VPFKNPFVDGGQPVGTFPTKIAYGEEHTLNFKRKAGKAFRFNANVGGTTASVFVPPYISGMVGECLPPPGPGPTRDI
jgi:hypothetical protein